MKQIKDLLPGALKTLATTTSTKTALVNTPGLDLLDSFETLNDPQLEKMKFAAEEFIRLMYNDQPPRWLSLLGSTGSGKSMLAKRIIGWARNYQEGKLDPRSTQNHVRYRRVGFMPWTRAMNLMIQDRDYGWMEQCKDDFLVCLDDIGVEYKTHRELSASKVFEIAEARLGKWTIITANMDLDGISRNIEARVASRLLRGDSIVVEVDVPDYNLRKRKALPATPRKR